MWFSKDGMGATLDGRPTPMEEAQRLLDEMARKWEARECGETREAP